MFSSTSTEIIQHCEFDILKYIRDICEQNGLRYFLAYGTLLGAIRHQGFIPWDDDMDIHMPRGDYMKFVEIIKNTPHPYYRLISKETSLKYTYIWSKVIDSRTKITQKGAWQEKEELGLFVDIFVLDGAGNSWEEAEAIYQNAFSIYCRYRRAVKKMFYPGEQRLITFLKWFYHIPEKVFGVRYWMNQHENLCLLKEYDNCVYVGALGAGTSAPTRNIWKRESFGNGTLVEFNGELFRAPVDWDTVLCSEYGDYMVLPPPEKRISNHSHMKLEMIDSSLLKSGTSFSTR